MKSLVVNHIANKKKWVFLPCDDTVAKSFADTFLEGQYQVYQKSGEVGTGVVVGSYRKVSVMLKNTAGKSTYISFPAKANKSDIDILTALKGLTFNGVKADTVSIVKMQTVIIGA